MKPGYLTTEFWLTILSSVLTSVGAIPIPHNWKGVAVGIQVAAYAIARGLAKVKGAQSPSVDLAEIGQALQPAHPIATVPQPRQNPQPPTQPGA